MTGRRRGFRTDGHDLAELRPESLASIPCFNEETSIGAVVEEALTQVDCVVVVDDGSRDATSAVAERAGALVIRHPANLGYGAALQTCFEAATALGAMGLILVDGDGQHLPDEIPKVLRPVLNGTADLCLGSRFLTDEARRQIPVPRQQGIRFVTWLVNALMRFPLPLTDAQCGFRAFAPTAFRRLRLHAQGMGASTEILWQARRLGLRLEEVPVTCLYDGADHALVPVTQGVDVVWSTLVAGLPMYSDGQPIPELTMFRPLSNRPQNNGVRYVRRHHQWEIAHELGPLLGRSDLVEPTLRPLEEAPLLRD